jgi:hypothetical protein
MKPLYAAITVVPVLAFLAACGGDGASDLAQDSVARNLTLAPADSAMPYADAPAAAPAQSTPQQPRQRPRQTTPRAEPPTPAPQPAPPPRELGAGTEFEASITDTVTTRSAKVGQPVTATVRSNVSDAAGRTVIPVGATVHGTVTLVKEGENPGDTGQIVIDFSGVDIDGVRYGVVGQMVQADFVVKGRGVTEGEVAKVGAGAAAGALAGQLLGKNTKSTVIGAVVGAAAGAGVASATRDQDVVIPAGARVVVRLNKALTLPPTG